MAKEGMNIPVLPILALFSAVAWFSHAAEGVDRSGLVLSHGLDTNRPAPELQTRSQLKNSGPLTGDQP
jgi:hypothetical protein